MSRILKICIPLLLWSFMAIGQNWDLKKEKDGVKVYTRTTEGAKFKSFKAITTFQCEDLQIPFDILKDYEKLPEWLPDIESVELVEQIGTDKTVEYHQVAVPWPFSGRDIVIESEFTINDKNSFRKEVHQKLGIVDEKKDFVRIKRIEGFWLFEKINEKEIKLTYQMSADPAGNLPAWVVNLFIVDGPFDTLANLRELINERQSK